MSTRILEGHEAGSDREIAVLFDSVTGWAFGPSFDSYEEAESFLEWLPIDPRRLSDDALADYVGRWRSGLAP